MKRLLLKQAIWAQYARCLSFRAVPPWDRGRAQHKPRTYSYGHGHWHSTDCHKMVAQRDGKAAEAFPPPKASILLCVRLQD